MDGKLLTESEVKTCKVFVTICGDIHIVAVLCGGNGDVCDSNVVSSVSFLKPVPWASTLHQNVSNVTVNTTFKEEAKIK
ncbi:hypothetical protein L1987_55094 [Smallanthus sonchifolius]|uniref:Uncharacterized protein n=1 Tax=Smallanthus sonchifolius TaxID=185202 RepID=A0ACB9E9L8_9ASTR|nr:hypothetical protein L1987_55094 [Smallanthus sonchifolius]